MLTPLRRRKNKPGKTVDHDNISVSLKSCTARGAPTFGFYKSGIIDHY